MEEDENHCAVCISKLQNEVYVPCSNKHKYHRKCLFEWAKTDYTCPMCREQFTEIRVLRENQVVKTVKPPRQIKKRKDELINAEYDAPYSNMACEICHGMTDEEHMLVCDVCDLGYHMYCVDSPMNAIPRGRWECQRCILEPSPADFIDDSTTVNNEYSSNSEDDGDTFSDESNGNRRVDSFNEEDEDILGNEQLEDPNVPSTSRSIVTMRELKQKRRKKKPTSPTKHSKRSSKRKLKDGKKSSKRRHKRRRKKRKDRKEGGLKSKEDQRPRSMHERIADVCGIDLRHSDSYKVVKRNYRSGGGPSSNALSSKLDLLGNAWIPPPDDSSGDELPTMSVERKTSQFKGTSSLLDEIIANQSRILAPSKLLKVNRDGTLVETDAYRDYLSKRDKKKSETRRSEKKSKNEEVKLGKEKKFKESNAMPKAHSADTLSNRGNDHMVILSACNNVEKTPLLDTSINIIHPSCGSEKAKDFGGNVAAISRQLNKRSAAEKRSVSSDTTRSVDNIDRNFNLLLNNSKKAAEPAEFMQQPSTSTSGNFVASVPSPFSNLSSDVQNAANVQHLFSGNPMIQNILHGAALPASSSSCGAPTTSSTMAAAAIAAAAFNATSKGFMPNTAGVNASMFDFFNHSNASSSSGGNNLMATANLLNASQHQSTLANLSNGIGLPQQQNNNGAAMEMLNRLISQQQQQAAVAAAFGFSSNHPLLFGAQPPGSGGSLGQHQLHSALMAPPSIPSSTSVMTGLLPPPPQILTSANGNVNSNGLMGLIPPPPPPTGQSPTSVQLNGARYGFNSPMDIDDDGEANTSSFNTSKLSSKSSKSYGNHKNNSSSRKSDSGEQRSETVKLADAAMKNALKPYFTKRMISKDEYKEIMKKGVAKLRNKEELKPDKVDRFVRQYVDLIAKRRKK